VTQAVRTIQHLVDPEISLSCCQELATEVYNKIIVSCDLFRYILICLLSAAFQSQLPSLSLNVYKLLKMHTKIYQNISIVN
jgi:hypothetical protein